MSDSLIFISKLAAIVVSILGFFFTAYKFWTYKVANDNPTVGCNGHEHERNISVLQEQMSQRQENYRDLKEDIKSIFKILSDQNKILFKLKT